MKKGFAENFHNKNFTMDLFIAVKMLRNLYSLQFSLNRQIHFVLKISDIFWLPEKNDI